MITYSELVQKQRALFRSGQTRSLAFRTQALRKLRESIRRHERDLTAALKQDLNKSEFESYSTEIGVVLAEIGFTLKHLRKWMKPRKVKTPITHLGSTGYIYQEPYGVALIIAPWNYPFQLAVAPLIGAIAAGNCAILKPSELTPCTSAVLAKLINEAFPEDYIRVIEGEVEVSQALLKEDVDYIFFTGSVPVGKIVMEQASKNLTPVTLELGGKSPCIVHEEANLKLAAKRIAWGKFMNAGQTCIAPDYLYVHQPIKALFLEELTKAIKELYGAQPIQNPNFTHIVSERHFDRLTTFLSNGDLYYGGETDRDQLAIAPTILTNLDWQAPVMQDEIFGPILPVLEFTSLTEVLNGVLDHPKPLSLYLFSENQSVQETVLQTLSFGGGCVNDTVYHFASPYLPFGGVGSSGIGAYHGKGSFDTFSHEKSVLKQTTRFDLPYRYPNVKNGLKKIKRFLK
ncbi:aldehyde dehydrogenase [Pullulanibacillus sp. KACC 23026]|uniref:aldehyde dehydrogenase n=1 Tax=Pullulanibacillus sp. KACC 23026 TaxID=3028315 RepID=UPI0023B0D732|nr:aldehyde dehydrogenase [Pullulanibacillus sp. KACC 23026]WEG12954.1 aldehyde dehydrogenase [Pullulanibacillus sp. KACC 23026]